VNGYSLSTTWSARIFPVSFEITMKRDPPTRGWPFRRESVYFFGNSTPLTRYPCLKRGSSRSTRRLPTGSTQPRLGAALLFDVELSAGFLGASSMCHGSIPPKRLESVRRKLRVPRGVRDILGAWLSLPRCVTIDILAYRLFDHRRCPGHHRGRRHIQCLGKTK